MSNKTESKPDTSRSNLYQIKIRGRLASHWSEWFEDLVITHDQEGNTLLTGPVIDDAALHGLLKKVRDLGLPLLSVNCVSDGAGAGRAAGTRAGDDAGQADATGG
jgi:hypothetical protein